MKKNVSKRILGAFLFLAVFAAGIAITMLLWNALIPSIIGWSSINYWQAAGLLILSRLLFGGFGKMRRFGHAKGHFFGHHGSERHAHLHEKLKGMSREERREYIRSQMLKYGPRREDFFDREPWEDKNKE